MTQLKQIRGAIRHGYAYKKQRGVQIINVFANHVIVVLVGNFLVDGPKACCRISLDRLGLQYCNCPEAEQGR